jgi:hypothetical protein
VLLVYFVGHGVLTPEGQLCLALSDTAAEDPDITGLEYRHVKDALLRSPAQVELVILDCCYSGRAIQALSAVAADSTDTRGAYTLAASDQAAHVPPPDQQAKTTTSFTRELLSLIRTGIPGGPERLTLEDLYPHLRHRLESQNLPAPHQRGTDTVTQFPFTRNAWFPAPGGTAHNLLTPGQHEPLSQGQPQPERSGAAEAGPRQPDRARGGEAFALTDAIMVSPDLVADFDAPIKAFQMKRERRLPEQREEYERRREEVRRNVTPRQAIRPSGKLQ